MNDYYSYKLHLLCYFHITQLFGRTPNHWYNVYSVIGLEVSNEHNELDSRRTIQYCHFDNNPEDRKDRSVMITLKFNDIRAVIQAHGHLDGCSQFVKVDLGIGDRTGEANRNASAAAPKEKRFSCGKANTL